MRHASHVPDWQAEGGFLMPSSARDIDDHRRRASAALPLQRAASMTRFVAVFVAVGVSIAGAGVTRADTGMLPGSATIVWDKFYIRRNGEFQEPPDPETRRRYLNLAHCTCAKEGAGEETEFEYDLRLTADTNTSGD